MRRLVVDAERFKLALTCRDMPSFLDRETGQVSLLGFYTTLSPEKYEEYVEGIYSNPDRHLRIAPLTEAAWDEFTGKFLNTLPAEDAGLLRRVWASKEPGRVAELERSRPELVKLWLEYRESNLLELAREWLASRLIEVELVPGGEA